MTRRTPETDLKWATAFVTTHLTPQARIALLVKKLEEARKEGPKKLDDSQD